MSSRGLPALDRYTHTLKTIVGEMPGLRAEEDRPAANVVPPIAATAPRGQRRDEDQRYALPDRLVPTARSTCAGLDARAVPEPSNGLASSERGRFLGMDQAEGREAPRLSSLRPDWTPELKFPLTRPCSRPRDPVLCARRNGAARGN